ncbi:MAG TPA: ABC transporter substrate-binding protein [Steroidobacteraceae bacterium]|nr:ABC transporter substrate-binding protein [Steroidobacteraceae bacterium]
MNRHSRRSFLEHAGLVGLALPLLRSPALANAKAARAAGGDSGRTLTVGMPVPAGLIDPLTIADTGSVCLLSQTGEYLANSDPHLHLEPALAESWRPNADGSVWTFEIRKNVRFHDGRLLTAADVVATMNRLADPANGSIALSAFAGTLSKGGTRALGDYTVAFELDAPNGSFPYLVSSDNYNAIILPADYSGDFERHFNGTGPFRLERYVPKARASFVRNDDYWGGKALVRRVLFDFYDSIQAQVLAMQGGQLDVLLHVPVQGSQALLADPRLNIVSLKSSAHEQVHLRTDRGPFTDKRVRRAIALCLNRDNLVRGLFRGRALLGNDSPFAPIFPATDPTVPQREQDLPLARQLLAEAGVPHGFKARLTTERFQELPDYAVVIQNALRKIGVDLTLDVEDQSTYYGRAVFGSSDWLDSEMGIEDYAHRGVPNTILTASLGSRGAFNAAHFKNAGFDRLVAEYIAALDPAAQRAAAGRIQRLLLEETPVIIAYFYDWLSVTAKHVSGVRPGANGQLNLAAAQVSGEGPS